MGEEPSTLALCLSADELDGAAYVRYCGVGADGTVSWSDSIYVPDLPVLTDVPPVVVFGSGGARKLPEGWPKERADEQFVALLSRIGPLAERHGVTIAVEPLARVECNYLNTVDEGARLARAAGSPAVGVVADCYHWARNGEPAETILAAKGVLVHAHLATMPSRKAPGLEPYDFVPFFRALLAAGYDGRVSIEGGLPPPETRVAGLRAALDILRATEAEARRP